MRIAVAEIVQETDSFSSQVTELDSFEQYGLYLGDEILEKTAGVGMIGGFLEVAGNEPDLELIPIIRAFASAGGIISTPTLEYFEDRLVNGIIEALPLDGIFLCLHGAAAPTRTMISRAICSPPCAAPSGRTFRSFRLSIITPTSPNA